MVNISQRVVCQCYTLNDLFKILHKEMMNFQKTQLCNTLRAGFMMGYQFCSALLLKNDDESECYTLIGLTEDVST